MATSEELLSRINESVTALQSAEQTVVQGAQMIGNAPAVASEAKTVAESAKTLASQANSTAVAAKTLAEGALSKNGGSIEGRVIIAPLNTNPVLDLRNPFFSKGDETPGGINVGSVHFNDKDAQIIGSIGATINPDNAVRTILRAMQNSEDVASFSDITAFVTSDGTRYATCNPPRENSYNNDIDTLRASINRHPIKLTADKTLHVGGANASDTANLFAGRGESEAMPFATLEAAIKYACQNFCGPFKVIIQLHANASLPAVIINASAFSIMHINSDSTKRNLVLNGDLKVSGGIVYFNGINLNQGSHRIDAAGETSGYGMLILGNMDLAFSNAPIVLAATRQGAIRTRGFVNFNGTCTGTILSVTYGGIAILEAEMSGSATGKRYACSQGGMIYTNGKGPEAIPGSITGTCDTVSTYA